jgi:copper chaperone CopZ
MKKAIIDGMCCEGCARDINHIFKNIYGVTNVEVSLEGCYVLFDGFVSNDVISSALAVEGYKLLSIEKLA